MTISICSYTIHIHLSMILFILTNVLIFQVSDLEVFLIILALFWLTFWWCVWVVVGNPLPQFTFVDKV